MIWVSAAILAALALAPAGLALRRTGLRGRAAAGVALYRAQLAELERDLAEGRISALDHATAQLEVQRRLLAAAEAEERPARAGDRAMLVAGLVLVPLAALALYLGSGSRPELPAQPLAARIAAADREMAQEDAAIGQLREALAKADPANERTMEGEILLGNLEAGRGRFAQAAAAWRTVLDRRFDPMLAVLVADAASRAEGRVSPESAALLRRALAAAPAGAPWRQEVEQRLASVAGGPLPAPAPMPR